MQFINYVLSHIFPLNAKLVCTIVCLIFLLRQGEFKWSDTHDHDLSYQYPLDPSHASYITKGTLTFQWHTLYYLVCKDIFVVCPL